MRVFWRERREGATLIGERRSFPAEGRVRTDKGPETGNLLVPLKNMLHVVKL